MEDYRPISLLSNTSKLFEIVLNTRIAKFTYDNNIIHDSQFEFRYGHSKSDVCKSLNDKEFVGACLIDLEKAFDTVNLDGLFYKMLNKKYPYHLLKMLWNMLHNKKFMLINSQGKTGKTFSFRDGLQQGAVTSPLLFNIFIYDLLTLYEINIDNKSKGIAFADDLIIYRSGRNLDKVRSELETLFRNIGEYFHTWKLEGNFEKCETILFRPKAKEMCSKYIKVWRDFKINSKNGDETLQYKRCVKYLEVLVDEQLKFTNQFKAMLNKARSAFFSNSKLFFSKKLNNKVKLLCYILLVRPHLPYACQNWYNLSALQMEELRKFERQCLRICLNIMRSPESEFKKRTSTKVVYKTYQKIDRND